MEVAIFAFEEDICALRQTTATAIFIPLTEPLRFDYGYKLRAFELKNKIFFIRFYLQMLYLYKLQTIMRMKDDVLNRVLEVYKKKSTSETQFAKQIGANQKTINQQLKGERSLSLDTVLLIINAFPDISAEWLLRGTETSIYPRIKELADIRGISMYTLSQETGISQSVLSRLKTESTAKLSRKNLEILANYFCVNIDWLATGRGDRYAPGIVKDTKIHDDALWERIEEVAIECFAPSDNKTIGAVDYHQFSTVTNIPEERLYDILQNNEFPYYSEILKIANVEILNLNLEWLLLGNGEMLKEPLESQEQTNIENINQSETIQLLLRTVKNYQKREDELLSKIENLQTENDKLKQEFKIAN